MIFEVEVMNNIPPDCWLSIIANFCDIVTVFRLREACSMFKNGLDSSWWKTYIVAYCRSMHVHWAFDYTTSGRNSRNYDDNDYDGITMVHEIFRPWQGQPVELHVRVRYLTYFGTLQCYRVMLYATNLVIAQCCQTVFAEVDTYVWLWIDNNDVITIADWTRGGAIATEVVTGACIDTLKTAFEKHWRDPLVDAANLLHHMSLYNSQQSDKRQRTWNVDDNEDD